MVWKVADGLSLRLARAADRTLTKAALGVKHGGNLQRLLEAAKHPRDAQLALLQTILARNAATGYGERHGFSRLSEVESYRRNVPVQSYEDIRELIERQELTGENCLTAERPVYYNRTSGTLGAPKNIPVTENGLKRMRRHQGTSAYCQSAGTANFEGKILAIGGQAIEGRMAGGTPFGSASGLLYRNQPVFLRRKFALPPVLSDIEDYDARYLAMAVHGLAEESVSCMVSANPSTFLRLLSTIEDHAETIVDSVATGRLPGELAGFPIKARPRRAAALALQFDRASRLNFADLWPNLRGVVCWTGGSCAVPLEALRERLPRAAKVVEFGYLASEARGTVNVDAARNICLPALLDTYFEFAERHGREAGTADFLGLHELEPGREYYVFVTTSDGLYRYDMNDILRVNGTVHATPTFEFVQKGKGTTNITGEKLTEAQVLTAVADAFRQRDIRPRFYIVLADPEASRYTLYVEADSPGDRRDLGDDVDRRLGALNIEYDGKRRSGRLQPLNVRWLSAGAGDAYRMNRVAAGQRDAQFKHLYLQYADECAFDFDALTRRQ